MIRLDNFRSKAPYSDREQEYNLGRFNAGDNPAIQFKSLATAIFQGEADKSAIIELLALVGIDTVHHAERGESLAADYYRNNPSNSLYNELVNSGRYNYELEPEAVAVLKDPQAISNLLDIAISQAKKVREAIAEIRANPQNIPEDEYYVTGTINNVSHSSLRTGYNQITQWERLLRDQPDLIKKTIDKNVDTIALLLYQIDRYGPKESQATTPDDGPASLALDETGDALIVTTRDRAKDAADKESSRGSQRLESRRQTAINLAAV